MNPIRDVVIVGGGTAGWMTAAALARRLGNSARITLVESETIGTVGVGEATIPPIVQFNRFIGIDEDAFVRETQATFKLGIEFVDWVRPGHRYIHPFGLLGADMNEISFNHFWLRWMLAGGDPDPTLFSTEAQAAHAGRFARTAGAGGKGPKIFYAYQFDAGLYAVFLRRFSEALGVVRIEGRVTEVAQHGETGFIEAVILEDGRRIAGDLFVDCSGFRGLLIEEALHAGYEEWSQWLPANRAAAVPCERIRPPEPYTRATAREAGWQWRIPLQHRTGNGYVFSEAHLSEDRAAELLLSRLDGKPQGDPRILRFTTGRRRATWVKNCVAIGLSSGFLEPLESTSIHLIHAAILKLLAFFPTRDFDPALAARFNGEMTPLIEGIRDFLIAHYKCVEREDTEFWRYCRHMAVPDSLTAKIELFRSRGEVLSTAEDLFKEVNWFAILYGQEVKPQGYHPLADALSDADLAGALDQIRAIIRQRAESLANHQAFLDGIIARGSGNP
ncbi:tryptophan 7-halogenase [Sphingomonas sp. JC676]|uniref:tryptophan halogenase family protein n=1 Tax=Sphingomonas sp. JC676 TaxID=2768065 RepID=UPI0016581A26|nr:tryptophan halogenase family protein [Sphingomonas sp. JC676]MBC9030870.1 tryptophan 7-halogenase [Sphingomonas sp. JC676]